MGVSRTHDKTDDKEKERTFLNPKEYHKLNMAILGRAEQFKRERPVAEELAITLTAELGFTVRRHHILQACENVDVHWSPVRASNPKDTTRNQYTYLKEKLEAHDKQVEELRLLVEGQAKEIERLQEQVSKLCVGLGVDTAYINVNAVPKKMG